MLVGRPPVLDGAARPHSCATAARAVPAACSRSAHGYLAVVAAIVYRPLFANRKAEMKRMASVAKMVKACIMAKRLALALSVKCPFCWFKEHEKCRSETL